VRQILLCGAVALAVWAANAGGRAINDQNLPSSYVPSGEGLYKQYCATCHGADAMGKGPLAGSLKTPPTDLTTLSKRHGGKFPYDYVKSVLKLGTTPGAHGSSDMPAWGPIFRVFDKRNEEAVQKRIKNLCDYLASIQQG